MKNLEAAIEREFGLGSMMRRREAINVRKQRADAANLDVEVFFERERIDLDKLGSITDDDIAYAIESIRKYCPGLLESRGL